jgi:hypothetical protein
MTHELFLSVLQSWILNNTTVSQWFSTVFLLYTKIILSPLFPHAAKSHQRRSRNSKRGSKGDMLHAKIQTQQLEKGGAEIDLGIDIMSSYPWNYQEK